MGWTVQPRGNDLLGPEVLNNFSELGQERKIRVVGVDSVVHDVLAALLKGGTQFDRLRQETGESAEHPAHFVRATRRPRLLSLDSPSNTARVLQEDLPYNRSEVGEFFEGTPVVYKFHLLDQSECCCLGFRNTWWIDAVSTSVQATITG